jgi:phosphoglycolate phosphatase
MLFPGQEVNPQLAEEFERRKLDGFYGRDFFPDARATLEGLRARGIKVAVCSNNFQENVDHFVADRDVKFDFVLGFRDGFSKGPAHFDYLLAQVGAGKPDMLFVGDSLKDAEKAIAYGIDFVGRTGTFSRDDFTSRFPQFPVIDTLSQLLELV